MLNEEQRKMTEKIVTGAAFAFFILITCYKLTNAPLWFDETIEYWYSKVMFGPLPFEAPGATGSVNMYQRIISTYQPPLYNFLMFFWLKVSDTEWWFRFFGVVMGFIGNVGIYKTIKKIGNGYIAAASVIFSTCTCQLVYYWQECAEYCLMLSTLCWTIYFFINVIEEQSKKNIVLFVISSILPVYSQYGATFLVAIMLLVTYIYILIQKDRKSIFCATISYVIAFIVAAVPLVFLFLKKQMENQQGGEISASSLSFNGNVIKDIFENLVIVFKSNFFSYFTDTFTVIFLVFFILAFIVVTIFSKELYVKLLFTVDIITWFFYYFTVKAGFYSYGRFGGRYNLFFIPICIITFFAVGIEIYKILKEKNLNNIKYYYVGVCCCLIVCFAYSGWSLKLQNNWGKDNMRDAVVSWIAEGAENSYTIVYYGGVSGFSYYLRQQNGYNEDMERNVNYMYWYRDKTVEEYTEYVNDIYGDNWPSEVYIIGTHIRDDFNTLISVFTNVGYEKTEIFNSNGLLVKLNKIDGQ